MIDVSIDSLITTKEEAPENLTNIELYQRYATAGEYAAIINKFRSRFSVDTHFRVSLIESAIEEKS